MTLLHCPILSLSLVPTPPTPNPHPKIPARDRTIPFGKHKGRMLGSLPSKYLTWVSKNLRARDSLEWAELADRVLADPVYRDRLEWESAERILTGNDTTTSTTSSVSGLLEISSRFGWDNDDKAGWARVDFDLLGTSRGGRIPRIRRPRGGPEEDAVEHQDSTRAAAAVKVVNEERGKREERRERRRRTRMTTGKEEVGGEAECRSRDGDGSGRRRLELPNPFPGRAALLDKVRRRDFSC